MCVQALVAWIECITRRRRFRLRRRVVYFTERTGQDRTPRFTNKTQKLATRSWKNTHTICWRRNPGERRTRRKMKILFQGRICCLGTWGDLAWGFFFGCCHMMRIGLKATFLWKTNQSLPFSDSLKTHSDRMSVCGSRTQWITPMVHDRRQNVIFFYEILATV